MRGESTLRNLLREDKPPRAAEEKRLPIGDSSVVRVSDASGRARDRRIASAVGVLLIFLFSTSAWFGWTKRVRAQWETEVGGIEENAAYAMNEAEKLALLQPGRSRDLLAAQQQVIEKVLAGSTSKDVRKRLSTLMNRVDRALDDTGRIHRVHPEIYLEMSLLREGMTGSVMGDGGGDWLFLLDQENMLLASVSPRARSGSILAGRASLATARDATGSNEDAFVLTESGIVRIPTSGAPADLVVEADPSWEEAGNVRMFGSNLYVFDRKASELYKYPGSGGAFRERQRWFRSGVTPGLSSAVDLDIDGSVWFLMEDGEINKFEQGSPVRFRVSTVTPWRAPRYLSVPAEGTRLWILDRELQSVFAFDRTTGDYAGQWISDDFGKATGLVVNETLREMFVSTEATILVVPFEGEA